MRRSTQALHNGNASAAQTGQIAAPVLFAFFFLFCVCFFFFMSVGLSGISYVVTCLCGDIKRNESLCELIFCLLSTHHCLDHLLPFSPQSVKPVQFFMDFL